MQQQVMLWNIAQSSEAVIPFDHTTAVDLNWSNEWMANNSTNTLWIANAWTVSCWFNQAHITTRITWISANGWANAIEITPISDWTINILTVNSSSGNLKGYVSSSTYNNASISHFVLTWDWTNLKLYFDATEDTTPTKNTDNSGTMTDSARALAIWARAWSHANPMTWTVSRVDLWNVALDQTNITAINDSQVWYKLDLRLATWWYDQQAALKQQWALGKTLWSASNIWQSYVTSWWVNQGTNASNISDADVVTFT